MTLPKSSQTKRFAVGARVVVAMSGQVGTVLHVDDEPSTMGEYVHIVRTKNGGTRRAVGCDLELVHRIALNVAQRVRTAQRCYSVGSGSHSPSSLTLTVTAGMF